MVNKRIEQIRTDALVAKSIHTKRLRVANAYKVTLSVLTIIVPVLFLAAQYWGKSTCVESIINIAASIGSVLLLCLSIYALIVAIEAKALKHTIGIKNNVYVASEALKLINEDDEGKLNWFYTYVAEMDVVDADSLSDVKAEEKQTAYREALMQLYPGDNTVACPICGASPFKYQKGGCQVCGNTPIERREPK